MPIADTAPRPRSSTELVDAAAIIARHGYASLLLVAAVQMVVELPFQISGASAMRHRQWLLFAVLQLARIAGSAVVAGAGVLMAAELYVGRRLEVDRALRRAVGRAWALARVGIVSYLATVCGLVALVFPGLIAIARFASASAVVVVEGHDAATAVDRSFELSRGNERRIIGAVFPTVVIVTALVFTVGVGIAYFRPPFVAQTVLEDVGFAALTPIYYTLAAVVYYDNRIRNEGFDVDLLMRELPQAPDDPLDVDRAVATMPATPATIEPVDEPTGATEP